jgi:hypothetical protein
MPNWACNRLTICGPEDRLRDFLEQNKGADQVLSFGAAVPYPSEFEAMDRAREEFRRTRPDASYLDWPESGYGSGGYEWCILSWGTKWDASAPQAGPYDHATGSITVRFSTAWSPPLPWLRVVAARWPDLAFFMYSDEPSMGWAQEVAILAGKQLRHRTRVVEDWLEDPDDEEPEPVWGPWRELPVDMMWDGWTRPALTAERARAIRDAGLGGWFFAVRFGLLPGEETMLIDWLRANHPDRLSLLKASFASANAVHVTSDPAPAVDLPLDGIDPGADIMGTTLASGVIDPGSSTPV